MDVKSIVEAIRTIPVLRTGGTIIQPDDSIFDELQRILGGIRPTAEGVNSLLRKILTTRHEIKPNHILKELKLSRTPAGMEWKVQVLELLQAWLRGENIVSASHTGDTQTLQPVSPADLRLSTEATLLAATGSGVVSEDSLHNIPHARKMLREASVTVPENDSECWNAWESERGNWEIAGHTFSATLVGDFFNSSTHVKNLFVVKRKETGQEVRMGPDDARGLFNDRLGQINNLETTKIAERRTYQKKAENTLRLVRLFDAGEQGTVINELTPFRDIENIGDAECSVIDKHYARLQQLWSERCSAVYSLDDFLTAVDNVQKVCQDVSGRGHTLNRFSDSLNNASGIITAFYGGNIPSADDVASLVTTYRELLSFQKQLPVADAYLASGRRVEEPSALMYARPRAHAALLMLDIIAGRYGEGELQIIDLCGNGVLHQVAKQLNDAHHSGLADCIVDLEKVEERALFDRNPNPRKVLVDFSGTDPGTPPVRIIEQSDSTSLQPAGKRIVVLNFVLNHFEPDEIKQAVLAAKALNPDQLLISLPENCQLEQSNLYNILQALGFRQELALHGENELEAQADFQIRTQRKSEISSGVKNRVKKPYRVYVFGKEAINPHPGILNMNSKYFELVKDDSNGRGIAGNGEEDPNALKPKLLQKLDATSNLSATNFIRPNTSTVSAHDIVNNPQYREFEEKLAAMLHFRNSLHPKERKTLDEIANLWVSKFVPSLTTDQVSFVMDRPNYIRIPLSELPSHLTPAQPQSKNWISLWQLYELERNFRNTQTGSRTVVQEHIPSLRQRLIHLLDAGMKKVSDDIKAVKIISLNGQTIDLNAFSNTMGGILKTVCLGGTVLMHKGAVPGYFAVGTINGAVLNANEKRTDYVFQAAPTWAVHPSNLTARFKDGITFSERVRLHKVNANYTDVGLEYFLSKEIPIHSVSISKGILSVLRNGKGELLAVQEKLWLSKALQVDIKDLDPAGTTGTLEIVSSSAAESPLYTELRDEPGSNLIDKVTKLRLRKLSELTEKLKPVSHPTSEDIQRIVKSVGFVNADINLCTNDEYARKEQELHFDHCKVSGRNGETLFITPMVLYPKDLVHFFDPNLTTAQRVLSLLVNANITPKGVSERGIKADVDSVDNRRKIEADITNIINSTIVSIPRQWLSSLATMLAVEEKDLLPENLRHLV